MSLGTVLLVALGGAVGAVARHLFELAFPHIIARRPGRHVPWPMFSVNVLGCFAMGFLLLALANADGAVRAMLTVGVCGAFTTMSGFALDTVQLIRRKHPVDAVGYVFITLGGCMLALLLGMALASPLTA